MNEGAAIGPNGSPWAGKGVAGSACGRLLAYFRERDGLEISGMKMDTEISEIHGDRNASTRKRGVCEQIDPRVEWISCSRKYRDGHLVYIYQHTWTRGRVPYEKPLREGGLTPDSRLEQIQAGTRVPPRAYYEVARQAGLLPEGFEIPAAAGQVQVRKAREAAETAKPASPAPVPPVCNTAGQGALFPAFQHPR
ncbi:MAG TPA: hypothetical protein PK280_16490 [Planctomycetota bacterium]|nr:hypothetical protein [Planctomycetota bacterium]